jgi:hypothetical protein
MKEEPTRSRGFGRFLLFSGLALVVLLVIGRLVSERGGEPADAAACNYSKTADSIETMKKLAIVYRVENEAGSPSVYVMGDWYEFPLEGKRLLDLAIRCRSGGAFDRSVYVHYYDYRSGKMVAISSSGGLTIY